MAAPVVTARQDPAGIKLKEGYQILVAFALAPTIALWEKTVKPSGIDGGDKIDQTTQHNDTYLTAAPRYLVDITDTNMKVAYDPAAWDTILSIINVQQSITVHFPDGSTLSFFGYLKSFEPDDLQIGSQPEATCVIVVTNVDPINCIESGPIMVPGTGSCV